jgi:hypothetical protein
MNAIAPVYIRMILQKTQLGTFFLSQAGVIVIVIAVLPLIVRSSILERAARDGTVLST